MRQRNEQARLLRRSGVQKLPRLLPAVHYRRIETSTELSQRKEYFSLLGFKRIIMTQNLPIQKVLTGDFNATSKIQWNSVVIVS